MFLCAEDPDTDACAKEAKRTHSRFANCLERHAQGADHCGTGSRDVNLDEHLHGATRRKELAMALPSLNRQGHLRHTDIAYPEIAKFGKHRNTMESAVLPTTPLAPEQICVLKSNLPLWIGWSRLAPETLLGKALAWHNSQYNADTATSYRAVHAPRHVARPNRCG